MDRLKEKWSSEKKYYLPVTGKNDQIAKLYFDKQKIHNKNLNQEENKIDINLIWEHTIEIVINRDEDRNFQLHQFVRMFNCETMEIVECELLEYSAGDEIDAYDLETGTAMARSIQVFGNTEEIQQIVDEFQLQLISKGFSRDGKIYRPKRFLEINYEENGILEKLSSLDRVLPIELKLTSKNLLSKYNNSVLNLPLYKQLTKTIEEFKNQLTSEVRNENNLQKFLTVNPILFGTDYKKIIPKHRLGSEFEMDYALEKFDGTFELVEIEASTHKLYTKSGNPTKELIHSEQQVLDWLIWVENKNSYAREKLKNIIYPKGYIIIGRNFCLTDVDRERLRLRNILFNGKLQILTYDDLLDKAIILKSNLNLDTLENL